MAAQLVQLIRITAEMHTDEVPGVVRYVLTLTGRDGESARSLIIDVPDDDSTGSTDVWVSGSTVMVGDTPADGFASFTPIR